MYPFLINLERFKTKFSLECWMRTLCRRMCSYRLYLGLDIEIAITRNQPFRTFGETLFEVFDVHTPR